MSIKVVREFNFQAFDIICCISAVAKITTLFIF